ncbi:hypothetical protein V3W47_12110 [Deinococcus sp. YIM 134068]|uniref:hypothetical protein n=1 Tax=Deinococcus lichenicola TaxID=3118910 RepID=UPI002F95D503
MNDEEIGLVYPDDLDDEGWPEDPTADPRFLVCSQSVKEQAFEVLWQPLGEQLGLDFELLDLQDIPAEDVPTALEMMREVRETHEDGELGAYLERLGAFLAEAMDRGQGVTVSL